MEGDNGKFNITGKVDGNKVNWSFKTDYNGTPLTISYAGKLRWDSKISRIFIRRRNVARW